MMEPSYHNHQNGGYPNPGGPSSHQYAGYRSPNYSRPSSPQQEQQQNHASFPVDTPPAMSSVFNTIPLGSNAENAELLGLVDQLRECRADRYVDLPVVVAVGDQSSGKSSALKALTGIPFPTSSVQCTRFATEIRLKREADVAGITTKVSILADDKKRDQARYDKFAHEIGNEDETAVFSDLFARAEACIFLHDKVNFLSRDVLIIERTGPTLPHLTIVDLPGIIHNPTQKQTAADVDAISKLSEDYMKRERTIILAVVGADVDYAKQVIIRRCKDADPSGRRTLGVITKPDMTVSDEIEQQFIDLANNKDERNQMQLGWHVLRNPANNERGFSPKDRNEAEQLFFARSRWGEELSAEQLGVEALSRKVSTQLIRHIAREMVNVEAEIEALLTRCRGKLDIIGYGWGSTQKMRDALHDLCMRSRDLTNQAVRGEYDNPIRETFFPPYEVSDSSNVRRLRACVVNENSQFSDVMENWGTTWLLRDERLKAIPESVQERISKYGVVLKPVPRDKVINEYVKPMIRDGRGQEQLVDHNPKLVYELFQMYSSNWPGIADKHIRTIQFLCEEFLDQIVQYAWPPGIRARVWRDVVKRQLETRLQSARDVLHELKDDRFRMVQTYHSRYMQRFYEERAKDTAQGEDMKHEAMLDKMLLHYEHQLPTFINNVIMQVVERKLVHDMGEIFGSAWRLSDLEVERLMEEDSVTESNRRVLKEELEALEKGLQICGKIARRPGNGSRELQNYRFASQPPAVPTGHPPPVDQYVPFREHAASSEPTANTGPPLYADGGTADYHFGHGPFSSPFGSRTRPPQPNSENHSPGIASTAELEASRKQAEKGSVYAEHTNLGPSTQMNHETDMNENTMNLSELNGMPEGSDEMLRERKKKKGKKRYTSVDD